MSMYNHCYSNIMVGTMLLRREIQFEMPYRSDKIFEELQANADPLTGHVRVAVLDFCARYKCSTRTMTRILEQFENAGRVRRLTHKNQGHPEFEVLCRPSKITNST